MYSDIPLQCPFCSEATTASSATLHCINEYRQKYRHGDGPVFYEFNGGRWWLAKCDSCGSPLLVLGRAQMVFPRAGDVDAPKVDPVEAKDVEVMISMTETLLKALYAAKAKAASIPVKETTTAP